MKKAGKINFNLICLLLFSVLLIPGTVMAGSGFAVLHSLNGSDGANFWGGLAIDSAGNIYGLPESGGAYGFGTVVKLDKANRLTVLHNFAGAPTDGAINWAPPILDTAGNIYGITAFGGADNAGTIFKVDAAGNESVLYSFTNATEGSEAGGALMMDSAGNLYGTNSRGGANNFGTIFKLDTNNILTVLHTFAGSPSDGAVPQTNVIMDGAGNLYGTTSQGGANNFGTIFKLDTNNILTVLHDFTGADGRDSEAGMIMDSAGNFYGTTCGGGDFNSGVIFKLDTNNVLTVLHSFAGAPSDGRCPFAAGVIMDKEGNLYGTTDSGGTANRGIVYELDTNNVLTVLHNFTGPDGRNPESGLLMKGGYLYGSTYSGGANNLGTIFQQKIR